MKEAEYAVTKSDKLQRALSLLVLLAIFGVQMTEGRIWFRISAAPVFATAMIWYADVFGCTLPWMTASRDIRVLGWTGLLLIAGLFFFL